ncbi:MAG TPA: pseudaminic acid cytidylyltransferase [Gammaproteobacteria bacterium]|nr:pseudaminic acid cytidylyltransferase [Gammaproteobacteria bacterium]
MKICIIPARGGSKRIPRKNIRVFCGKPVIAYSIEQALASGCFDKVIVSTDDHEIASIAKFYGAEIPFIRPEKLSDDYVATHDVIKHAIQSYICQGEPVSVACCIYATAPFIDAKYLKQGYTKLIESDKSYSFSVTSFPFPVQRAIRINKNNGIEAIWPENIQTRSQDLEEAYHDAGQFYWGKAEAFMSDEDLFSDASTPVVLPRYLVQDLDTLEDWQRAELMYQAWLLNGKRKT